MLPPGQNALTLRKEVSETQKKPWNFFLTAHLNLGPHAVHTPNPFCFGF
jgi:hypothetical protein